MCRGTGGAGQPRPGSPSRTTCLQWVVRGGAEWAQCWAGQRHRSTGTLACRWSPGRPIPSPTLLPELQHCLLSGAAAPRSRMLPWGSPPVAGLNRVGSYREDSGSCALGHLSSQL
jgi:hypothetical protein